MRNTHARKELFRKCVKKSHCISKFPATSIQPDCTNPTLGYEFLDSDDDETFVSAYF